MTLEISTPALLFPAVVMMSLSLASLIVEILISGGALRILLGQMEDPEDDKVR
ncbi:MAG: hypothetical protein ACJAT6_000809 [Akkermansiaceae bacterium]|jgi:hypothetical protein